MKNFTWKTWFRLICISAFALLVFALIVHEKTEEFLPKPDVITVQYGGKVKEFRLSDEQADRVYQAFRRLADQGVYKQKREEVNAKGLCPNDFMLNVMLRQYKEDEDSTVTTVKFKYYTKQHYVGDLTKQEGNAFGSAFVFDEIAFGASASRSSYSFLPSVYGVYYTVDGAIPELYFESQAAGKWHELGHQGTPGTNLIDWDVVLQPIIAEEILKTEHTKETEVIETDSLLIPPDDVILVSGGKKAKLTAKQKDEIYDCFANTLPSLNKVVSWRCTKQWDDVLIYLTDVGYLTSDIDGGVVCLELIYDQPRKFTGTLSAEESGVSLPSFEYDALFLVIPEMGDIVIRAHRNGEYVCLEEWHHYYLGFDGYAKELKNLVHSYYE